MVVVALIAVAVWGYNTYRPRDEFSLTLRTPSVAAGVTEGSAVRIQGIKVGTVTGLSRLAHGVQGVRLTLDGPQGRSLTNNVQADFAAGNLFGVSEVILTPHDGGGSLVDGAELSPSKPIADSTVANMIATIGDVNDDALRPHMSRILMNVDASSKAMLPLLTTLGSVTQAVKDTQRVSTAKTFPIIARTLDAADSSVAQMIPAVGSAAYFPPLHNGDSKKTIEMQHGINDESTGLLAGLQAILTPEALASLKTLTPVGVSLLKPILGAFPDGSARGVGVQLSQLLDNVRRAMPNTPNGPVLNLRLSVDYPAIGAALPQGADVPPNRAAAAKPGTATEARPAAPSPSTP